MTPVSCSANLTTMNNETTKQQQKAIMKYLIALPDSALDDWRSRDVVREKLKELGAEFIGSGCFSYVYRVGNLVVKISSQSFEKLKEARRNPVFKRLAPTIYWIHQCGKALVCKFIEEIRFAGRRETFYIIQARIRKLMKEHGFAADDMHLGNLVKIRVGNRLRWSVPDYGCWVGN